MAILPNDIPLKRRTLLNLPFVNNEPSIVASGGGSFDVYFQNDDGTNTVPPNKEAMERDLKGPFFANSIFPVTASEYILFFTLSGTVVIKDKLII